MGLRLSYPHLFSVLFSGSSQKLFPIVVLCAICQGIVVVCYLPGIVVACYLPGIVVACYLSRDSGCVLSARDSWLCAICQG